MAATTLTTPRVPQAGAPADTGSRRRRPPRIGVAGRTVSVLVVLGVAVFPIYWMLTTALTSDADLFAPRARLVPDLSRLDVFADALTERQTLTWLRNSAVVAVGTTALALVLGTPLAYALSRFSFVGKAVVGLLLLMTQMLPEALLVVPIFSLYRRFDLLDSLSGLVLANTAFVLPIVALVLKGAIDGIPRELEESARVDGCGPFRVLTRINIPIITPSLAAASVIAFFHAWNEYVFAVTFIFDKGLQPASVGLAGFVGEQGTAIQTIMAVAFLFTLPAVAFYLFAQKYVVSGMTAGAVKG